jgi:adenosylmethionine-8-amino-7-oxononanoate aminotransferase
VQQEGSEANRKRTRFLALTNAYNGDTIGAVSLGGVDIFHERFRPMLFECIRGPSPYAYRCDMCAGAGGCNKRCLDETVALIREHAHELVAVVLEPGMQGAGGIITYPDGYLQTIREVTRELGILLILDEVAVGMGRSGKMFACEREGVVPDFICVAKMLTGGYLPVAATLTTQAVYDAFLAPPEEGKTFFHGHTFTGNPLGCAAALAVLDIFEKNDVIANLESTIAKFGERLHGMRALEPVGDTRQYGLAGGAEIVADRDTREPHPAKDRVTQRICRAARDHGVFMRPLGNVLVFMPPLSITHEEIDLLFDAAEAGIRDVLAEEL